MNHRDEVFEKLRRPLDPNRVRLRDAGRGRQVPYIEGHDAITTANEVFGFDGWSYHVDDVHASTTTVGRIFYRAVVTVEALGVRRTDIGLSIVELRRDSTEETADAHDVAIKGAVTDGLKRALRSFGAQFGNELYDKTPEATARSREAAPRQQRAEAPPAEKQQRNVGDFFAWAWKEHHVNRTQVLQILGVERIEDIGDLDAAGRGVRRFAEAANK